jgi:hypothetical protein
MEQYLERARVALANFDAAAETFRTALDTLTPNTRLPKARLEKLRETADALPIRTEKIRFSLGLTERTVVDIVDLQARLEGQSASLAQDLASLGETLEKAPDASATLGDELSALEERSGRVASALFPNAIEGLRDINRTLWDLRPIVMDYERTYTAEVTRTGKNRLTATQLDAVRTTTEGLTSRFDAVNDLLNRLAVSTVGERATVQQVIKDARRALAEAIRGIHARAGDAYKPFHPVLRRVERLAEHIDKQFADLRVPVFPVHERLAELNGTIDAGSYGELVGVERMALLNVTARLKSVAFGDGEDDHLLSRRFKLRVFEVFPDRIYFSADASFIDTVATLAGEGLFDRAPAGLHRFNEGSFKQKRHRKKPSSKGNLQVSYARVPDGSHTDAGRVNVDADLDLYRGTFRHLFGEVLVNHLTGKTTDQFRVWDILASADVEPIGGFDVITA